MTRESVDTPELKLLGRALGVLRKRAGLSQAAAGDALGGFSDEGWRKYETGQVKAIFSPETQTKLARAVGASREELLDERARLAGEDPPSQPRAAPHERQSWVAARMVEGANAPLGILDAVQAGAWMTIDDMGQTAPKPSNVLPDPRFPNARQYVSTVRGDSMNLLSIVEDDWVHWVEAADIGYYPKAGDIVRVERIRFGGQEREVTLKQVEIGPEGILLWPRSTNPRHKSPIELTAGVRESEDVEVVIRGLVLAAIKRF